MLSRSRTLTAVALPALLVAMLAVVCASASAQLPITSFQAQTTAPDGTAVTQAGGHPDSTVSFTFPSSLNGLGNLGAVEGARNVTVDLPPGLIGNPSAFPKCSTADLVKSIDGCPVATQVGFAELELGLFGASVDPQGAPVYNITPPAGEPAEFAFNTLGIIVRFVPRVRTGGDYGLSIDLKGITESLGLVGSKVTLWGVPANPSHDAERGSCLGFNGLCPSPASAVPFMTNSADCAAGALTTALSVESWQDPGAISHAQSISMDAGGNPSGVTGCEDLAFAPTLSVHPQLSSASSPTGLTVALKIQQNENPDGLGTPPLKRAVVTLPAGMTVSPSAADGLGACPPEEIALESARAPKCPDSSRIGSVSIATPLLEDPLSGSIYLAQQGSNPFASLLAIYLVAEADGVVIKLPGKIEADPTTGQLTAIFDDDPQLPFSELKLEFNGGSRATLANPPACGTYETKSQLSSWGGQSVESDSSFEITEGENGTPCPEGAFAPAFTAGSTNPQGGAFSPFTLTFSRSDAEQDLGSIAVRMPPGLLGVLKSAVQCPEPQASQGACGPSSAIGHTTVGAGPGSDPFYLGGQVYLTGPYKGAPFGLSIVVPAVAGPLNLGTVVVRASIAVDPHTAQLTISSDPLPTILQGIPLDIRTVNVTVDRGGFMFNPSSCASTAVNGTIASATGASTAVSSRFQVANCAVLAFKPKLTASTQAKSSRADGASLDVKITSGSGQANIGRVAVDLPKQLPSRLTTIQKACPAATFAANPASCPAGSLVGTGSALTPILAHGLSGPAYLVSHGGAAFPDLVVVLRGEGITIDLVGAIDITKAGITSSTFSGVPDVPISSFELKLPTGSHSALTANLPRKAKASLCSQSLSMPTSITGQNGALIKQSTRIAVSGCGGAKTKTAKSKSTTKTAR